MGASTHRYISFGSLLITSRHGCLPDHPLNVGAEEKFARRILAQHGLISAALDTTVRTLYPESIPRVLVSDTVGFINNLPHGLVASFKSTLKMRSMRRCCSTSVTPRRNRARSRAARRLSRMHRHERTPSRRCRPAAPGDHCVFPAGSGRDRIFSAVSARQLRGEIFARCEVLEERADEEGAFFRVRGEQQALESLREQFSQAG